MSPTSRALRDLIDRGDPVIAADCYSALTGRIVEQAGFEAAYMGGHATSAMHYGIPDVGVFTATEMIDQAARVAEAISIPLIVDADQAGESIADVFRSVRRYERVGVAGLHLEDEVPPKHSSYDGPLMSVADMAARIAAAVDARDDPAFVIIARSDELYSVGGGGTGSLDEAVRRGVAAAEAGADLFLPTFATPDQLEHLAAEVPIPLAAYGVPVPNVLLGLATGWGVAGAARTHQQWARHLRQHGALPPEAYGFDGMAELIDEDRYNRVITRWAGATARPVRATD